MPLRRKLLLSMVIPALLLGMMGAIGIYSLRHLEQAAGRILSDNYRSIQEARRMARSLQVLESQHRDGDAGRGRAGGEPPRSGRSTTLCAAARATSPRPGS